MPHKRNPISAENMCGLSRLLRTNAMAAMENQALWHERDISHSSVERVIMPDCTILADYVLHRLTGLLRNLRVLPESMKRNLWASHGLFFSQRVLNALLSKGLPRQEAYVMVQRLAAESWEKGASFPDLVRREPALGVLLTDAEKESLFDTSYYIRYEAETISRVLAL